MTYDDDPHNNGGHEVLAPWISPLVRGLVIVAIVVLIVYLGLRFIHRATAQVYDMPAPDEVGESAEPVIVAKDWIVIDRFGRQLCAGVIIRKEEQIVQCR